MKTHKPIALRFWIKSDVNPLRASLTHVSLVLYFPSDPLSKDPTMVSDPKVRVVTDSDENLF